MILNFYNISTNYQRRTRRRGRGREGEPDHHHQQEARAPPLAAAGAAEAPGEFIEAIRRIKRKIEESEILVRLLEGNSELIRTMTSLQLGSLLASVRNGLGCVCSELTRRSRSEPVPACSSCFAAPASVEMQPCGHSSLCSSCVEELQMRNRRKLMRCPECGVKCESILSSARWAEPISDERYKWESSEITKRELQSIGLWRNHKHSFSSSH